MDINHQNIIHLLESVTAIKSKYDEFAKLTGENFNFLRILNKEHYENYHSAIISELLNEKGSHGQGNLFLNIFIDVICKTIDVDNKKRELKNNLKQFNNSYGRTENSTNDGRIDIFVEDKTQVLIIENKIGANDQNLQMKRYYDYSSSLNKENVTLLYLWKDYIDVNTYNENNTFGDDKIVREKTVSISYKNEIKEWISLCIKECSNLPIIRETLNQYLNSVNTITNQATNNKMEQDLISTIISNKNYINSALYISNNVNLIQQEILKKLGEKLSTTFQVNKDEAEYTFKTDNFNIIINFWSNNYEASSIGIRQHDNLSISTAQCEKIKNILSNSTFGKIENWSNYIWNRRINRWKEVSWSDVSSDLFSQELLNEVEDIIKNIESVFVN